MVHTFIFDNKYFAYDVESGSVLKTDKLTNMLLQGKKEEALKEFGIRAVKETQSEIDDLKNEGLLFASSLDAKPSLSNGEIKSLCLHICHDCNLNCAYCFGEGGSYSGIKEHMSLNTAKAAIDFVIEKSGKRKNLEMDFFGGEPLLNFDTVIKTVEYARQRENQSGKKFKFTLTTNGLLLNDAIIDFLNKEMDNVVISIDGRQEVHDNIRKTTGGKPSYDVIMKNALKFRRTRGDKSYYIRGTFTALNTDFSKDVLHLNDCGFDQISVEPVVLAKTNPLALKESDIENICGEYETLAKEYIIRRRGEKWFNFFHFMIDINNGPCLKKRLTGCGAGDEYMAVAPSGDLYPCHQFVGKKEYFLGNVFDGGVNQQIRDKFVKSNLLTKPGCAGCFAKYFCSGGCAYNNINYGSGIDSPDPLFCKIMRKRFECSLAIYAEENS
jgi:uncharacterized protein